MISTDKEVDVLFLLFEGESQREIARRTGVSLGSVGTIAKRGIVRTAEDRRRNYDCRLHGQRQMPDYGVYLPNEVEIKESCEAFQSQWTDRNRRQRVKGAKKKAGQLKTQITTA